MSKAKILILAGAGVILFSLGILSGAVINRYFESRELRPQAQVISAERSEDRRPNMMSRRVRMHSNNQKRIQRNIENDGQLPPRMMR